MKVPFVILDQMIHRWGLWGFSWKRDKKKTTFREVPFPITVTRTREDYWFAIPYLAETAGNEEREYLMASGDPGIRNLVTLLLTKRDGSSVVAETWEGGVPSRKQQKKAIEKHKRRRARRMLKLKRKRQKNLEPPKKKRRNGKKGGKGKQRWKRKKGHGKKKKIKSNVGDFLRKVHCKIDKLSGEVAVLGALLDKRNSLEQLQKVKKSTETRIKEGEEVRNHLKSLCSLCFQFFPKLLNVTLHSWRKSWRRRKKS